MASLAKGLPVFFIPEQFLVTPVRNDVIHHGCRGQYTILFAFRTERIPLQEGSTGFTPTAVVSALYRIAAHTVGRKLHMFLTINALVAQIRTSRIATGAFCCFGHFVSPPREGLQPRLSPRTLRRSTAGLYPAPQSGDGRSYQSRVIRPRSS